MNGFSRPRRTRGVGAGGALAATLLLLQGVSTGLTLEPRWQCDLDEGARGLPLVVHATGSGVASIYVTSRFDGTLWTLSADGQPVARTTGRQWLEGQTAATSTPGGGMLAFQDSLGSLHLASEDGRSSKAIGIPGEPRLGTGPCFVDLNRNGRYEVVCARRNGVVTAVDRQLRVLWQYNANAPIDSTPAAGPVFVDGAGVYVQSADGAVHCISGGGRPLWRTVLKGAAPRFPLTADLLLVELSAAEPVLFASDRGGWLYALDAGTGAIRWEVKAGSTALGAPAFFNVDGTAGNEIVTVSERGEISGVSAVGSIVAGGNLPEDGYVSRPLIADVDDDEEVELLVATRDGRVVVARIDGTVEDVVQLQGSANEGIVLHDVDRDGQLELLAATDGARVYCFGTRARDGWTHPRAGTGMNGCASPVTPVAAPAEPRGEAHAPRWLAGVLPEPHADQPFGAAVVHIQRSRARQTIVAVLRHGATILGSAVGPMNARVVAVPFAPTRAGRLTLDVSVVDDRGRIVAHYSGLPIGRNTSIPVALPPRSDFLGALLERGSNYRVPPEWRLPLVAGRDCWSVLTYQPDLWRKYGLDQETFVVESMARINASAANPNTVLGPEHPAWPYVTESNRPFFVLNDYFRPTVIYPGAAIKSIDEAAGDRFLGFQVHEWAYRVWKDERESGKAGAATRKEATEVLRRDFARLMERCHGRIYAGEGYGLFHHHAYRWGAPICYAEIGENIPLVPLAFAFIRGAARQHGGRPWGAYVSNWFRGAAVDNRLQSDGGTPRRSPTGMANGPDCGHSASLEFRMLMAAHLAGATFIHHESDAYNGSVFVREKAANVYELSDHGAVYRRWFGYTRNYPDRGVPYTPIAFLFDFHHGWRPGEDLYGIWPPDRATKGVEQLLRHVYAWDGRLDFERGYLTPGPYGDIFDALTSDADLEDLKRYGAVWLAGDVEVTSALRRNLEEYVEGGGILVADSATADRLPYTVSGASFSNELRFGANVQTALQAVAPTPAPYRFRPMRLEKSARPIAWTESGAAVLAWRRCGRGLVITSATDHWLDESERLVPQAPIVLRALADAFLPVTPSADVQLLLNRTERGYLIGLINHHGVLKTPTRAPTVDPNEARTCLLTFRGAIPRRFQSRMGEFRWNLPANGIVTELGPGEAGVVEIELPN